MIDRTILAVLLGLLSLGYALHCPKQKTSPGREVVCYTSARNVEQLNDAICRCTTLVQQGYDLRNLSTSGFTSFQKSLKGIKPTLQFMISVDDPAKTLRTSGTVRQEATALLLGILKEVDGVELNVTAGSKERLVHFMQSLKNELVKKSYDKRIFLVLPTKPENLAKQFDLKELSKYVDLFTVATDYLVEDDEAYHTFHPSRLMGLFDLVNADSLIDLISGLGAPKRKILVSVPASVYKFTLKDQKDNTPRSTTVEMQPDIIDQKELCDMINEGEWTIERDEDLTAPYAFKNTTWVAFEDKLSIAIKGKYALIRDLPGLAIRNVENDFKTKCGKPLTHEIHHSFTDFKRKSRAAVLNALEDDLHQTQITYPNKVRSSEFRVVRVVDTEGHIQAVRENTQTEFICTRQGYFVHPKSCNRFYRCVKFNQEVEDYSVFEFDCPAGLAFDERAEVCVWPGSLPQGSPCPGSSEIAPVTRVRFECPTKSGYYADPQNPRWFFACLDLGGPEITAYEFRCPFGLIFDEQKLVCEWPWLVQGYSGNGYTRSEYDNRAYGHGSSQGTGGYVTGGLPDGYSGTTSFQSGGHSGTNNIGYSSSGPGGITIGGGSGFSGAAGVGYAGSAGKPGSVFGQGSIDYSGSIGGGYSGSAGEGPGVGGIGYSGAAGGGHGIAGTGYSGSAAGGHGVAGSGYSGSVAGGHGVAGTGYSGSAAGGHGGAGSGYAGSAAGGHGVAGSGYSGSAAGGHGVAGSGYSGSVAGGHGIAGTGYSGSVAGGHGVAGSGYSGSVAGGHGVAGTRYSGSVAGGHGVAGSGYSGSTDSGYSGSVAGGHGVAGTGYSGSVAGGHGVAGSGYSGSTDSGYSGSVAGGHGIVGTGYSGSAAGGQGIAGTIYSGTAAGGHGGAGSGYSGSSAGAHGAAGNGYSGSVGETYDTGSGLGTIGTGYTGTTIGGHGVTGTGYSGTTIGGHGVTGTGYSGAIPGHYGGLESSGVTGSIGGSYAGSTAPGYSNSVNTGYSGTTVGVYTGSSHIGSDSTKYSGTSGSNIYSGITGTSQVPIDSGYTGSGSTVQLGTSGIYDGSTGHRTGSGYSDTASGAHAGAAAGGYAGSSGISYSGSTAGGYTGSTGGVYVGSGTNYVSPVSGGCTSSTSATPVAPTGTTYTGSAVGGCTGSASGNSIPVTEGYIGSGTKEGGYSGTSTIYYSGSPQVTTVSGHAGGFDYSGSTKHGYSGQTGSGLEYSGSQGGSLVPVQTVTIRTQPEVSIHDTTGTIGSGYAGSVSVTGAHGQTSGSTFLGQHPERPSVNYIPGSLGVTKTPGVTSTSLGSDQIYLTGGSVASHGIYGQSGVTSTYYGKGGVTTQTNIYQGTSGFTHGYHSAGDTGDLNITLVGGVTPSVSYGFPRGSGGIGTTVIGQNVPGSIITGHSSPGTLITYGNTPGTIISGSSEQGTIITGSSQPGYTKTGAGTPGYVINEGVKTVYSGSASPGTVIYGTSSPGIVLTGKPDSGTVIQGESSPGITLTGQAVPGVTLGGSIDQGTVIGSGHQYFTGSTNTGTTYGTKIGGVSGTSNTGYQINEYHDNGGRGTIKFNNGDITTKYRDNDIPDYRPAGGIIPPDTFIPSSTFKPSTPSGFTKTGPTKTGITTATLAGHGSYVVGTGRTHPTPSPDKIGVNAFEGNVVGYTKTSTESSTLDTSYVDTSKITLGPSKSTGYSYPKPNVAFETGVRGTTPIPIASTESNGLTIATPTPFLNVEVYNTPKFGEPSPVTVSPAVVDTYGLPSGGNYKGNVPVDSVYTHPTATPVTYTTGPFENYKTTAFEAAKIPVVISTVHPVIDTGYQTIISSTPVPVTISQDKFGVQAGSTTAQNKFNFGSQTSQQGGFGDRHGYISSTTPSSVYGIPSTTPRPFGFASSVTVQPEVNYVSTESSGYHYSQSTLKSAFGQTPTTSISGSLKPQTQYLPSDSISPAIGVTFRKPFQIPGVTYQPTTPGSLSTGGSPTNIGISKEEVNKLVTNYNRGSTKYVPNEYDIYSTGSLSGSDASRTQTFSTLSGHSYDSTLAPFSRTQTPHSVTTYIDGYSKPSTIIPYQTPQLSTAVGKGKVIVKWSDLHPLLLGKLGAECTCRGDPFANLRGPGSKLINSDKGKVDLSNYDESEIYVDLEKDGSYENNDYVINDESSSPSGPIKIWNSQTPAPILSNSGYSQVQEQPSSVYLPSVTPSVKSGFHGSVKGSSPSYLRSSPSHGLGANYRSGKSLNNVVTSTDTVGGEGASFDRYGPGGLRDSEETLEGATNCARPGLFRHPNFCNKFYACHWDEWKKTYTLHVFNCPVHLTFDNAASACNWPSMGPACQDDNLRVEQAQQIAFSGQESRQRRRKIQGNRGTVTRKHPSESQVVLVDPNREKSMVFTIRRRRDIIVNNPFSKFL